MNKRNFIKIISLIIFTLLMTININNNVEMTDAKIKEQAAIAVEKKSVTTIKKDTFTELLDVQKIVGQYQFNVAASGNAFAENTSTINAGVSHVSICSPYEKAYNTDFTGNSSGSYLDGSYAGDNSSIYKAYLVYVLSAYSGNIATAGNVPVTLLYAGENKTITAGIESAPEYYYYTPTHLTATGWIDVTDFVKENGYGWYYCCNIPYNMTSGGDNFSCWRLVVIEEKSDLPVRLLKLSFGNKGGSNSETSMEISGDNILTKKNGIVTGQFIFSTTNSDPVVNCTTIQYSKTGNTSDYINMNTTNGLRVNSLPLPMVMSRNGIPLKTDTNYSNGTYYYTKTNNGSHAVYSTTADASYFKATGADVELFDIDGTTTNHNITLANGSSKVLFRMQSTAAYFTDVLGMAVDINVPTYECDIQNQYLENNKIAITGTAKNTSETTQNCGLFNGAIVLDIDSSVTVNSVTATFTREGQSAMTVPSSMITIDNTNHKVKIMFGPDVNGRSINNDKVTFTVNGTINTGKSEVPTTARVEGYMLAEGEVETQLKLDSVASDTTKMTFTNPKGAKTWIDNNNAYNTRPANITINLYRNGTLYKYQDLNSISDTGYNFGYIITKDDYNSYSYTMDESPVNKYVTTYNGMNVTNKLKEDTTIDIVKVWDDNEDLTTSRPDTISYTLKQNGNIYETSTITSTNKVDNSRWKKTVTVPKYDDNGVLYTYTLVENTDVPNYSESVLDFIMTNTIDRFKITTSCDASQGSITDSGNEYVEIVNYNGTTTKEIEITANYGYGIEKITINGVEQVVTDVDNMKLAAITNVKEDKNIVVTFYRKESNVTAKYIDQNGKTLAEEVATKNYVNENYTTSAKDIYGYNLTATPNNATGKYTEEDIVVNYVYELKASQIIVNYVDEALNNQVIETETIDGKVFDEKIINAKDIDGYILVSDKDSQTITMEEDVITITFKYRKLSDVVVKYIDENYNSNIIDNVVVAYKEGDAYTTEEKSFEGYELTSKTDNISGTVVRDNIEVVYKYKKISAGVDIMYIDQATGLNIIEKDHLDGLEKDTYTTEAKDIEDYVLVFTPDNKDGEMTVELTTVVYEYRMLSDVTTKFIDENYGTEIADEVKQTYKEGDPYSTKAKNLDGYQLVGQTNNTNGTVGREDIVVEYKYKKISAGVETKYIDQVTKEEIATPTQQSGLEKDAYTTSPKDIAGYELVLTPDNKEGEMTVELITVTYEYRLVSKVTTKYIDVNSRTEIVTAVENNYKEGDTYTTEEKILEGYELVGKSDNTSGTMERSNIEVIYEYKKISQGIEVVYVDQVTGSPIAASVVKTGLENQEYTTEAKIVDGYELVVIPSNANGKMTVGKITVKYEYRKLSDVVAKYIDVNYNTEITQEVKQTLKEGDLYTTEQKSFDGYQLTGKTDNTSGVIARENIEVVYEYKKISAGVDVKFIDQVTGEEIADKEHQEGLEKDNYTTTPKTITNYELVKTPTNKNGEMTVDLITVTYEYRLVSKVTTKHIDANTGKEIVAAVVETYKEGDAYTTTAKDLVGYILTKSPEVPNGTMGRENVEVVYEYKMISDGLIVKYIDEITGDLLDMENYTGNENDMIQLEEKSFDKYILTKRPAVSEIKLTVEPQEVRFYYKKLIDINVIGIDAITGEEIYRKVQNGVEGEGYETTPIILPGYEISKTPNNASGTYTREEVDVIYEYKRVSGGVIVTYVDKDTREILDSQTITGYVGEEYEAEKKAYEKYDFVEVVGNPKGKLEVEQIEITYLYAKKSGMVEIVYVDTEGNELLKEEISGKVDEAYSIRAKEIEKYRLVETDGEVDGQFEIEKQIVKFVFEKIKGKITINFVDKDGNILFESVVTEGEIDEEYYYEALEKEGYEIAENAKIEVKYIDGEIIIDVVYEKIELPEPPATGDINVIGYITIMMGTSIVIVKKLKLQK